MKLITTIWSGDATDSALIDSFTQYLGTIRSRPDYAAYNEILDFSKASDFKLTSDGLRRLVQIASQADVPGVQTRLAIIVDKPVAYGLARMYEAYRTLVPNVSKTVRVFRDHKNALRWIAGTAENSEKDPLLTA